MIKTDETSIRNQMIECANFLINDRSIRALNEDAIDFVDSIAIIIQVCGDIIEQRLRFGDDAIMHKSIKLDAAIETMKPYMKIYIE